MSSNNIPIIFDNQTGQKAYVQFLNGHFGAGQTGANGAVALTGDKAYSFDELTSDLPNFEKLGKVPNVSLNDFTNGRMYINLGDQGLSNLGSGYQPSSHDSSDPNYNTRYGFIELNVFGSPANNMDLSYIDFFSISMSASTWKDGNMVHQLTSPDAGKIIDGLAPLSQGNACVPAGIPKSPYTDFVRVIGPGHSADYHNWTNYFKYLEGLSYKTSIAGYYAGNGTNSSKRVEGQNYKFTASFDSNTSQVTLSGSADLVGDTTITISYSVLNSFVGVYGANPAYTIKNASFGTTTNGIINDVFGWVVGDLLAGLNMGFLGSKELIPNTKNTFGQSSSSEWFTAAGKDRSTQFSGAQSDSDYYNAYAGVLQPITDAYGFPFSDRLPNILLYFPPVDQTNGVDYLKITLMPYDSKQ